MNNILLELGVFFFQFAYYIFAIFLAFYIPGKFFLKGLLLRKSHEVVLAVLVGLVLWAWQGYIFGYLQVRWLSYFYLLTFLIFWLKENPIFYVKKILPKIKERYKKNKIDWLTIVLIAIGTMLQLSTVWFVGTNTSSGIYFCCGNTADNILHISIVNEIAQRIPPFEPGMYGQPMQNYHYWGNLVVAELVRVFHLPLIPTMYQFSMFFLSLFLGLSAVVLSQILQLSKIFYRWLLFFLYLGGDTVFLFLIGLGRLDSLFKMSSLEDGAKFLANPPRSFAIVLYFAALSLFAVWLKRRDWKSGVLMSIIFGSLVGFKVYVGFFAFLGLIGLAVYYVFKSNFRFLGYLLMAGFLSAIIYFPVNTGAGGLYYTGLWRFENFIAQPALGFTYIDMEMQIFREHNNWLRIAIYEIIFIVFYLVVTFGTKLVGLFQTKKSLKLFPKEFHILLIPGLVISFILGSLFQQTTGGANTFNFLVSVFVFGSLYSALACTYWSNIITKRIKAIGIVLLIILTIPRVTYEGWRNFNDIYHQNGLMVSNSEIEGINYLKNHTTPDSLVYINLRSFLWEKESSYYSFLSNRPIFLSGVVDELEAHGIDYSDRKEAIDIIFNDSNVASVGATLAANNITHLVLKNNEMLASTESAKFLDVSFKNEFMKIYRVSGRKLRNYLQ